MLTRPGDRTPDTGSVLLLFPAAVLIMMVLGAIVVDVGLAHVRGRELRSVAESAANDVLAAADQDLVRSQGRLEIPIDRALVIAADAVDRGPLPDATVLSVVITPGASGEPELIDVTLGLDVDLVLAPAVPGAPRTVHLERTGHVRILSGP